MNTEVLNPLPETEPSSLNTRSLPLNPEPLSLETEFLNLPPDPQILSLLLFQSLSFLFPEWYVQGHVHCALDWVLMKPAGHHFQNEEVYCHDTWIWLSLWDKEQILTELTQDELNILTKHNTKKNPYQTLVKITFYYLEYKHWKSYHIMLGDKDTANKKNNINIDWQKWTRDNGEGEEGDYTDWTLFDPSPVSILNLRKRATEGRLRTAGFHKGEYKTVFPRCVTLSDAAFALLIEAGVVNNTLNKNWLLDYNSEGKPFIRPNHAARGNPAIAPNGDIFQWGAVPLTSSNSLSKKDKLTVLVKGSVTPKAAGGKSSSISTPTKKHQPHPNPKQKDITMGKVRTRKKVVTPQGSNNKENSAGEEPDNEIKTETKPIPVHKTKAKKKPSTLLDSDNDEPKANEGVNPASIETLSDRELCVDAEEPNKTS
ncbi:hypothetical protein MMC09_003641 [Bachmanniomyces sp. S44760]|nr:hypothetical protein [Bachmanniomyces sp. S44760]